jgi:anaerobic selenocysteine-containing dehydrogenase
MYADYIIPDTSFLERWGTPHTTPDVQTATSKIRQPLIGALTETVQVDGEDLPVCMETFLIAISKRLGLSGVGTNGFGVGMQFNRPEDYYLKAVANIAMGDKEDDAVPDADQREMDLFLDARRYLPRSVFEAGKWRQAVSASEWPKVVNVLNRGGRFEDFSKAYSGSQLAHKFGKMVSFFAEETAETRNSITGEYFSGLPVYGPVRGADGVEIDDTAYEFQLITYKEIFGGHSRTISNYWSNVALQPANRAWINSLDADRLDLKEGDAVRLTSASNPEGTLDLGNGRTKPMVARIGIREGIRPGVVAVSWHYGHWAYGSSDVEIDGQTVAGDSRRSGGLCANPLLRTDTRNGDVGLTDPIGGSAAFYDTRVNIRKENIEVP